MTIRKAKRQPLTETAMRLIASEAQKVGMTAFQAVVFPLATAGEVSARIGLGIKPLANSQAEMVA